jgi:hypothetical protein
MQISLTRTALYALSSCSAKLLLFQCRIQKMWVLPERIVHLHRKLPGILELDGYIRKPQLPRCIITELDKLESYYVYIVQYILGIFKEVEEKVLMWDHIRLSVRPSIFMWTKSIYYAVLGIFIKLHRETLRICHAGFLIVSPTGSHTIYDIPYLLA